MTNSPLMGITVLSAITFRVSTGYCRSIVGDHPSGIEHRAQLKKICTFIIAYSIWKNVLSYFSSYGINGQA